MKGQNCSSISSGPKHWPNPSLPLIRAINPEREEGCARGADGGRRGVCWEKMKETRTDGQLVFNCRFFHLLVKLLNAHQT